MIAHTQHFAASAPASGKGRTAEQRASDLAAREAALAEREARMAARAALLERDRRLSLREEAITMREQAMGGSKADGAQGSLARTIADEAMALQAKAEKSGGTTLSIAAAVHQVISKKGLDMGNGTSKGATPSAAFKESLASKQREREMQAIQAAKLEAPKPQDKQPEQLAREIVVEAEKLQGQARDRGSVLTWVDAVFMASRRLQPLKPMRTAADGMRPLKA